MAKPADFRRSLILSDIHAPYHDERALAVAEKLCRWLRPHSLILAGDIIDCYPCSRFDRDPDRSSGKAMQAEIDTTIDILDRLRKSAGNACEITYLAGNHEDRLHKTLLRKAPELCGIEALEVPALLHLDELGITYLPSSKLYRIHGLVVEHGQVIRSRSGYSAKGQLDKRGISGVSGHTHRLGVSYHSDMAGTARWAENGCLCSLTPEYLVGDPDWQHGCTILWHDADSGHTALDQVHISDGRALYHGQTFAA
jgi:predicted phosphodiesterase